MNMFKPTQATNPDEYIALIQDPARRADIQNLHDLIRKTIPDLKPRIVAGMIGYGIYHYKGKSGREGDWSLVLLASQKQYISLYACAVVDGKYIAESYKSRLPKADIGKSCIRFKHLSDVDVKVLMEIVRKSARGSFGI